tara:strand:- start:7149 stop:7391 length:243 start_codon:yes stop_codon:yes gene_type:complete
MKDYKYQILLYFTGAIAFIGILILWVLIFTTPFWLVWNCIIATKFTLPTFTFAEAFFVILIVKWLFGTTDLNNLKKELQK